MAYVTKTSGSTSVTAYAGDAKTLLAFNLTDAKAARDLAGFTIQIEPEGHKAYYLYNTLQYKTPGDHAQDSTEPPNSSINAPIHKFRWVHVPGSTHQGIKPFYGKYTYRVTPRYFDDNESMKPLDPSLTVAVSIDVGPFSKQGLEVGFTRGFTQSQAFVHRFGKDAKIRPKGKELLFDTSVVAGVNAAGEQFTYDEGYDWLGFTAQDRILAVLREVLDDSSLRLDVFAYDLNAPYVVDAFLKLAKEKRIRVILDDAALHHGTLKAKPEDEFTKLFRKLAKDDIRRGHISRYAHDKVFIVSDENGPTKVLTGSTNFSVTGLYVNSNHVLVFNDAAVAAKYAEVFEAVWDADVKRGPLLASPLSTDTFTFSSAATPKTEITFAPHAPKDATRILDEIAHRIDQEGKKSKTTGSVLFAVMQIDNGTSPVYQKLNAVHKNQKIFSYGISDSTKGIALHEPEKKTGVLVTGKPVSTVLPPPFDQVPSVGLGHQVHHKFVVCGFNDDDAVVYCGSSNLAIGGEESNGDNLLAIHDGDVATVFAIEALALVDHFEFLDRLSKKKKKGPVSSKKDAAVAAGWFLSTTDRWTKPYFSSKDLKSVDRLLFARA